MEPAGLGPPYGEDPAWSTAAGSKPFAQDRGNGSTNSGRIFVQSCRCTGCSGERHGQDCSANRAELAAAKAYRFEHHRRRAQRRATETEPGRQRLGIDGRSNEAVGRRKPPAPPLSLLASGRIRGAKSIPGLSQGSVIRPGRSPAEAGVRGQRGQWKTRPVVLPAGSSPCFYVRSLTPTAISFRKKRL